MFSVKEGQIHCIQEQEKYPENAASYRRLLDISFGGHSFSFILIISLFDNIISKLLL